MRALVKILVALFGVVLVFFALVFVLNMGDVIASPKAAEIADSVHPMPGFALGNIPQATEAVSLVPQYLKFSEYLSKKEKMDALLAENADAVQNVIKAYKVRSVAVLVQYEVPMKTSTSMGDAHKLFLLRVSQLIADGKKKEADALLVNANEFLLSVVESPQLHVSKLIALSLFEANALFVQDLVASKKWASVSPELKASLRIAPPVQQIIETSIRGEFLAASSHVHYSATAGASQAFGETGGNAALEKFLLRPQETMNWLAQIYSDMADPACDLNNISKCSATYKNEIETPNVVQMLSNPVGRKLVSILVPNSFFARDKIQSKVDAVNAIAAGL